MKSFTKLEVWQEAYKLTLEIYSLTDSFPDKERYNLISQMNRAAISVASNIAATLWPVFYFKEKEKPRPRGRGSKVGATLGVIV